MIVWKETQHFLKIALWMADIGYIVWKVANCWLFCHITQSGEGPSLWRLPIVGGCMVRVTFSRSSRSGWLIKFLWLAYQVSRGILLEASQCGLWSILCKVISHSDRLMIFLGSNLARSVFQRDILKWIAWGRGVISFIYEKFSIWEVPRWQMVQYLTKIYLANEVRSTTCNGWFFLKLNQGDFYEINTSAEIALQIFVVQHVSHKYRPAKSLLPGIWSDLLLGQGNFSVKCFYPSDHWLEIELELNTMKVQV